MKYPMIFALVINTTNLIAKESIADQYLLIKMLTLSSYTAQSIGLDV